METNKMETYDGIYIINPNLHADDINDIISTINNIFSQRDCSVIKIENWGVNSLAYEIDGLSTGYYVKFTVNCDYESVTEYDVYCKKNEYILRYVLKRV